MTASSTTSLTVTNITEEYVNAPEDLSTTYDGQNHWIDSFSDAWIKDYHSNENAVTVQNVSYAPNVGSVQDLDTDTSNIKNAGVYTVKMGLAEGFNRRWSDETIDEKFFTITVGKTASQVNAVLQNATNLYITQGMPQLVMSTDTATIAALNAAGTPYVLVTANCTGTASWGTNPAPTAGLAPYSFSFTPTGADVNNYEPIPSQTISMTFKTPVFDRVEVVLTDTTNPIYSRYSATKLEQWFTVYAVYTNGDRVPSNFTILLPPGGLVAGSSNDLEFVYDDGTNQRQPIYTLTNVIQSEVERLSAHIVSNNTIYTSSTDDDIKRCLRVTAVWNSDESETVDAANYNVILPAGGLVAPSTNIKVSYGGKESAEISLPVTAVALESISVESHTCTGDIYPTSTAADIQNNVAVVLKGTNNDGSAYDDGNAITGYTLTPAADFATSGKVKVTYNGKETEFTISLGEVELESIALDGGITQSADLYHNSSLADVQAAVSFTLKGTNNDGSAYNGGAAITGYTLALGANFANDGEVVVTYNGKTTSFNVTLTPVAISGLTATYTLPAGSTINALNSVDDLNAGLTVVLSYNDGTTETLTADNYTLEAAESELHDGKLKAGLRTITVIYSQSVTTTFTAAVDKINYTMPTGYPTAKQFTYTGAEIALPANWITGLPEGVTVKYYEVVNNVLSDTEFTGATNIAVYNLKAVFSVADEDNYNVPAPVDLTFQITDKYIYTDNLSFTVTGAEVSGNNAYTATYSPDTTVSFVLGGNLVKNDGTEVTPELTYKYEQEEENGTWTEVNANELKNAGKYRVTVSVANDDATYEDIPAKTATLTIEKADFDMSGISFEDLTKTFNGTEYTLEISGELPDWITPSYSVEGQEGTKFSAAGTYKYTATFTHTNGNYKAIPEMKATLTISDAVVTEIKAELSEKNYTTANTLDDLKAKLKVTAIYNNGTEAEIEDYELDFTGLRDGGKFKYGNQSLTVKYGDFTAPIINNVMVSREKVALPTFKGGLKYTGVEVKPKAADFNGYDSAIMTFVLDKTVSGLTVGSYKAVFALNDPENYEWATTTTYKKALFAVALYDEEITLLANEAAVDWNISRATLTATKADGALPVFASESFIGAFSDVVTLKYYRDEACTEEVEADKLAYETQYYVKAELLDTANFELDASAAQYTVKSFSYTTPAKELTLWDKIVKFVVTNWLWLVIAVVALILFITIIALIARSAKRKREREERRLAEEKAERERKEERDREERRLEREERMARLSQAQAAPAPQYIPQSIPQPQYMPQGMPQNAQSAGTGGGSINEAMFMQMQAEFAAMKAEQAAKELAEIKAEQAAIKAEQTAMRNDFVLDKSGAKGQMSGINVDAMTEIMTMALKNLLASAAQPIVTAAPAQPAQLTDGGAASAATQVPPDAVMTTVTTTKIDTTKKTAQAAQNAQSQAQSARPIVRNYVAPMPVDDGRVFDVGGFYTPADPLTDMGFDEEEKKD